MHKVSIIIPARNELFLVKTVEDLLYKAAGDIEIIAVLDGGGWPIDESGKLLLPEDPRLVILRRNKSKGMRDAVNSAASIAKGKYLMKVDAHTLFGEGYDEILQADCADNWIVVPRRYSLDTEEIRDENDNIVMPLQVTKYERRDSKPAIDYVYYFYPYLHPDDLGLHARPWWEYGYSRKDIEIDENISFQGSCWLQDNP